MYNAATAQVILTGKSWFRFSIFKCAEVVWSGVFGVVQT